MQLLTANLPRNHKIYWLGDLHLGTIAAHKEAFEDAIARVARERNSRIIGVGDYVEAIPPYDKRWAQDVLDPEMPTVLDQFHELREYLKPVKKKVLFLLEGNHEAKLSHTGSHVKWLVCDLLDIPFGTYAAKLSVRTTSKTAPQMYKIFNWHGKGQIKSHAGDIITIRANEEAKLKRTLRDLCGDALIMARGHAHKLMVIPPTEELYLVDQGGMIKQRYTKIYRSHTEDDFIPKDARWYVSCGGFLRSQILGASTYIEKAGLPPNVLGYPVLTVENGQIVDIEKVIV
jgi:hypothetical protein